MFSTLMFQWKLLLKVNNKWIKIGEKKQVKAFIQTVCWSIPNKGKEKQADGSYIFKVFSIFHQTNCSFVVIQIWCHQLGGYEPKDVRWLWMTDDGDGMEEKVKDKRININVQFKAGHYYYQPIFILIRHKLWKMTRKLKILILVVSYLNYFFKCGFLPFDMMFVYFCLVHFFYVLI